MNSGGVECRWLRISLGLKVIIVIIITVVMMFYDREWELESLEDEFESDGFSLFVVYGRRRVGKTELVKEFCEDKSHIYHLFSQDTPKMQRERLVERIAEKFDERVPRAEDWRDVVKYLAEKMNEEKMVVGLDEFPYAIRSDDSVVSHFQYLVDELVEDSESMLILLGSTVSVMENQVMGYKSPLYGRRSGQIDLQPFSFGQSLEVIDYGFEEAVKSFTVTGGTPFYLTAFDYSESLEENIRENLLNPSSALFEEPEFLLRQEVRNPSRYMSILESIAKGYTTPNEISGNTGIESSTLTQYLDRLKKLRLVERVRPVTASEKSRRSIYIIRDNFIDFWFQSIASRKSEIEENPSNALETVQDELKHQHAGTFEQVCREAMVRDRNYPEVGRWWYKEDEIDVAGLNPDQDKLLLGECKWTSEKVGKSVLRKLENKEEEVQWRNGKREVEYALFSKFGFTEEIRDEEETRKDLELYGLEKLESLLTEKVMNGGGVSAGG